MLRHGHRGVGMSAGVIQPHVPELCRRPQIGPRMRQGRGMEMRALSCRRGRCQGTRTASARTAATVSGASRPPARVNHLLAGLAVGQAQRRAGEIHVRPLQPRDLLRPGAGQQQQFDRGAGPGAMSPSAAPGRARVLAASRYALRRRSSYFSMPWQGFGPAGRYRLRSCSTPATSRARPARGSPG